MNCLCILSEFTNSELTTDLVLGALVGRFEAIFGGLGPDPVEADEHGEIDIMGVVEEASVFNRCDVLEKLLTGEESWLPLAAPYSTSREPEWRRSAALKHYLWHGYLIVVSTIKKILF